MTQHLSTEEISEILFSGAERQKENEHLRSCPECRAEVANLQTAISTFAGAARDWSRESDSGEVRLAPVREAVSNSRWRAPKLAWGLAAAMVVLLMVFGALYRRQETPPTEALNSVSDDVLLQQIDSEVSRRAPQAMEPLVRAISEGASSASSQDSTGDIHSQQQGETK